MSSASWALQQAVFATLSVSEAIRDLIGERVFDVVPRGSAFPYIVVGDDTESAWDTATEAGSEHALSIHVWSRAGGRKESKLVADAVREALDGTPLTLTGHALIDLRFRTTDFAREPDGETFRAILRFRAVTEPA